MTQKESVCQQLRTEPVAPASWSAAVWQHGIGVSVDFVFQCRDMLVQTGAPSRPPHLQQLLRFHPFEGIFYRHVDVLPVVSYGIFQRQALSSHQLWGLAAVFC